MIIAEELLSWHQTTITLKISVFHRDLGNNLELRIWEDYNVYSYLHVPDILLRYSTSVTFFFFFLGLNVLQRKKYQ